MLNQELYNPQTREFTVPSDIVKFVTSHAPSYGKSRYWINHFKANGRLPKEARDLFFHHTMDAAKQAAMCSTVMNPNTTH